MPSATAARPAMTTMTTKEPDMNPLISGFHPDPSICRVGEYYYLVSSTFEYLPGIPIYRSRDMEHFELLAHVIVRDGQSGVKGVPTGGGVWAPTIRHHDGLFYLVVPDMMGTGRGNVLFTAEDPAGPWSDGIVMDVLGIDPDIVWDEEGACYVTMSGFLLDEETNTLVHQGITQVEFDPATGKALTEQKRLWSGTGGMFPEAPHLYKIGDYWYLMIAEGGTERGHSVSIARGPCPDGPFTGAPHNPLVTARGTDRPVQNSGHGDLVQLSDGSWGMVLLGTRPRSMTRAFAPIGRETFFTPVTWVDGWPHVEPVRLGERRPAEDLAITFPSEAPASLRGFDGELISVRAFPWEIVDLEARPGFARIEGVGVGMEDAHPRFLGMRVRTEEMVFTAALDLSEGVGGICLRYEEGARLEIEVASGVATATMTIRGLTQSWSRALVGEASSVALRIGAEAPQAGKAVIGASCDRLFAQIREGGEWVTIGAVDGAFLSSDFTESFAGRVIGAYARSGRVDVERFDYRGRDVER
ncbi:glycoside hydrolase family 43 protein [Schaalia hyovaginalis]|uniref:glycoside hydrolase family 43 protein n=1 Tax=Schaalia hyovaginalis TaxID=29316 RepID=UPI0026F240FA|nr:glycoside hydrolase family 43 protein [Schaalia hyovaginalis]MCI6556196.1 glycoside hydrolase family 43 protein [Schaalia hyovaginalis]MDD7553451.1 family 43 glycosylhydrolase [Schaalia hyovaginalis]